MENVPLFILGVIAIIAVIVVGVLSLNAQLTSTTPAGGFSKSYQDSPEVAIGGYGKCSISCTHCTGVDSCFKSCRGSGCRAECVPVTCDDGSREHEARCTCESYAHD